MTEDQRLAALGVAASAYAARADVLHEAWRSVEIDGVPRKEFAGWPLPATLLPYSPGDCP